LKFAAFSDLKRACGTTIVNYFLSTTSVDVTNGITITVQIHA